MFKNTPDSSDEQVLSMWLRVKPMRISVFEHYWSKIDAGPLFDLENTMYDQWVDDNGWFCIGMRSSLTGKHHGFVRRVFKDGQIIEGTFRNGVFHGLERLTWKS